MYNWQENGGAMAVYPYLTESVKGPPQGQWGVEDWENLNHEGRRYEVLNGILYVSIYGSEPQPLVHQDIVKRFYLLVGLPAEQKGLAFTYFAPVGLYLPVGSPIQPDFVVVLPEHKSILVNRWINGVPDMVAEILSPETAGYDEDVKLKAYAKGGVPEYVVIDPVKRQLRLYTLKAPGEYGEPRAFNQGDTVTFTCLPTITVTVSRLFEGAPDTAV
jgi:Uma2 family endonuclease